MTAVGVDINRMTETVKRIESQFDKMIVFGVRAIEPNFVVRMLRDLKRMRLPDSVVRETMIDLTVNKVRQITPSLEIKQLAVELLCAWGFDISKCAVKKRDDGFIKLGPNNGSKNSQLIGLRHKQVCGEESGRQLN